MAALTANRVVTTKKLDQSGYIAQFGLEAGANVYEGSFVAIAADGRAKAAQPGDTFFGGIALDHVDNSSGSDDALTIDVLVGAYIVKPVIGVTKTEIGDPVYANTDNELELIQASASPGVGYIVNVPVNGTAIIKTAWIGQPVR